MLAWLLVESIRDMSDPDNSYSGVSWFGLGPPLVIGIGIALAGLLIMVYWRVVAPKFWEERPGVADPEIVHSEEF